MRRTCLALFLVPVLLPIVGTQQEEPAQLLAGPYLGMAPPGDEPVLFAPRVVADVYREHSGAIFSPDGKELFWTIDHLNPSVSIRMVLSMRQVDGVWAGPELAAFNSGMNTHVNSFSPEGSRLYVSARRQAAGDTEPVRRTWIVEKTETGWDRFLPDPVLNAPETKLTDIQEANSGNRYGFGTINTADGIRGLMVSRLVEGEYLAPEPLWLVENPDHLDHSITVDPDESFVIFASRRPGEYSEQDLYTSYRQQDGTWGPAINLGEKINTTGDSLGWPHLSPDGRYLFFAASTNPFEDWDDKRYSYEDLREIGSSIENGLSNLYWVSTGFVDRLRPEGVAP